MYTSFSDSRFFLYGPPGVGKSTLGKAFAAALELDFFDLDEQITAAAGTDIPSIFASHGEDRFREMEGQALRSIAENQRCVIALGGGALLSRENRNYADLIGRVVCLQANTNTLVRRLEYESGARPLLGADPGWRDRLIALVDKRRDHYASFSRRLDTSHMEPAEALRQLEVVLGSFRVSGMGQAYDVRVLPGGLDHLGGAIATRNFKGPVAIVCDQNIFDLYARRAENALKDAGFSVRVCVIPAGEENKNINTVNSLWSQYLQTGLERGSTVVALGGGVVGDLAGFAAATYLRGLRWVAVPTSLLAMVDASLGGKTGFDLPEGKNLVGSFHPPSLVLADPKLLVSLPEGELRSGMAEVIKHGIIADPALFMRCAGGWDSVRGPDATQPDWDETVRRAMAVKIRVIQDDPYEQNIRATLNLGHTLGHAIEAASGYHLRHGEAVAIGTVAIARIAALEGYCTPELAEEFVRVFQALHLPVEIPPGLNRQAFHTALYADKKRAGGKIRFAIPYHVGRVEPGISIERDFTSLLPEAI
jgi:3-dehydroquinate synthase